MLFQRKLNIKSITDVKNLQGKTVLVRCDFNVALKKNKIIDDYKIIKSLPTIRFLTAKRAKVILVSHLGRPKSLRRVANTRGKYSLKPVATHLKKLLGKQIFFIEDFTKNQAQKKLQDLKNGQIALLENIRLFKGEETNDEQLAKKLSGLADLYVNDAMAVSHRPHASVSAIKTYLPAYAGLLLAEEVTNLHKALHPTRPLVVIIGGSKIETKVKVIKNLKKKAKFILIGGMITYDFLAAKKLSTGKYKPNARDVNMAKKALGRKIILPLDFIYSDKNDGQGEASVCSFGNLTKDAFQLDIGPQTIRLYAQYIKSAKTIIWNGPMGMFEAQHFQAGTLSVARLVASVSRGRAFTLVGGGETVAALRRTKMLDHVDWVSTSGGATLAYLAREKMPGLQQIIS